MTSRREWRDKQFRQQWADLQPVTIQVRCKHRYHKISWDGRNLILHNHTKEQQRAERAMKVLASEEDEIRCLTILDQFRQTFDSRAWWFSGRDIPRELAAPIETFRRNFRRLSRGGKDPYEKGREGLRHRMEYVIRDKAEDLLNKSRYWLSIKRDGDWRGSMRVLIRWDLPETNGHLSGTMTPRTHLVDIMATIQPARWFRLYKLGAALVDGYFMCDVVEINEDRTRIVATTAREHEQLIMKNRRNVRRFSLVPWEVTLVKTEEGWRIEDGHITS